MGPREPDSPERDRALVEAVLSRTPVAFEALVRAYQGLCWRVIHRMVRHPEDTRELCQETFLRVHRHLRQYRFESPLRSWIAQVAYSIAARHLKRKRLLIAEPRVAQYRLLTRILSEPAEDSLPHNFAALVAQQAEAASERAADRFELWVQRGLLAVLALTAVAFFAGETVAWLQILFVSDAGGGEAQARVAVRWLFAIALCIAMSFLIELWDLVNLLRRSVRL